MTTQYFEYGNTITDISEHQYYKCNRVAKSHNLLVVYITQKTK